MGLFIEIQKNHFLKWNEKWKYFKWEYDEKGELRRWYVSRKNSRRRRKPFIPHFNVYCNANDLLEIKPFDSAINDRLNIISYKKKYVDNPSNEFELQKDHNLEEELKSLKFIEAFQFILFDSYLKYVINGKKEYIPDAVKNCKTEWVGEEAENTTINKFLESYEITNNVEYFTKSADTDLWI